METKPAKPAVYGLVISLLLIILSLVTYFTHQMGNSKLGSISYVIIIVGIIISCIQYAKQMQGNVTFGNVFAHGFKTTCVVIVIQVLYFVLATKLLFPDMVDISLEAARQSMMEKIAKGNMTQEQADAALDMSRKNFMTLAIMATILGLGIIGAIASLIGAAAAKKNPQPQNPF